MGISSFQHLCRNILSFLLFTSLLFLLFWIIYRKQKQKRKSRVFAVFAVIRPFLSQIKHWFSVIYTYIGQFTPHPPRFWHSQGGSALVRNFLFFIFVKYSDFFKFRFSTEFWAFSRISYLLLILHKFSRYSFSLIFVRYGAFYAALR